MSYALFVCATVAIGVLAGGLLYYFTAKGRGRWYVLATVWLGWFLAFSVLYLMPTDVESTFVQQCMDENSVAVQRAKAENRTEVVLDDCHPSAYHVPADELKVIWGIVYWSIFALCWFLAPIIQEYCNSGAFRYVVRGSRARGRVDAARSRTAVTDVSSCAAPLPCSFKGKMMYAMQANLVFYGVITLAFCVFLAYIAIVHHLTGRAVFGFAIAASNCWGLFCLIVVMSYGLVEVPRQLWSWGDNARALRHVHFRAVGMQSQRDEAQWLMDDVLSELTDANRTISERDMLYTLLQKLNNAAPESFRERLSRRRDLGKPSASDAIVSEKALAKLRGKLKRATFLTLANEERWERLVREATELEDVITATETGGRTIEWTFPPRKTWYRNIVFPIEYEWYTRIGPIFWRVLAVLAIIASLIIIWCEATIFSTDPDLSLISQMIHVRHESRLLLQTLVFFFVLYMVLCSYSSLFKIRVFSYYEMTRGHSDHNSLLFNTAFTLRLVAPLCYNFLFMIHETESTAFAKVMGSINAVPFFGKIYNAYFPIVIVVLTLFTFFNFGSRIMALFGVKRFAMEQTTDDGSTTAEGRELVGKARDRMLRDLQRRGGTSAGDAYKARRAQRGPLISSETSTSTSEVVLNLAGPSSTQGSREEALSRMLLEGESPPHRGPGGASSGAAAGSRRASDDGFEDMRFGSPPATPARSTTRPSPSRSGSNRVDFFGDDL